TSFQPQDVEDVVHDSASRIPDGFAVEDHIADGQLGDRLGNGWVVLEQPVARIKFHLRAIFECEYSDSIELSLEDPLGSGEAFLCERRRHRHNPFGEGRRFLIWHTSPRMNSNGNIMRAVKPFPVKVSWVVRVATLRTLLMFSNPLSRTPYFFFF